MNAPASSREGILAGGHWIVDHAKIIESWPSQDALVSIIDQSSGNGGCAYNLLKDLARLQCGFPLAGVGLIGDDADGDSIVEDCLAHGIDASGLSRAKGVATSYTDVMTVASDGRRTFFHQRGANALLDERHFAPETSSARIFHLGYLALLDTLDHVGADGRTGTARLFQRAAELGMVTIADLVSSESGHFPSIVGPSLPWLDWLFLNEFESSRLTGLPMVAASDVAGLETHARAVLELGVRRGVFIHSAAGAVFAGRDGKVFAQGAVAMPRDLIRGSAGAGDAFASGCVLGLHDGWDIPDCLELAVCAAAASLRDPSCSAAILPWTECLEFGRGLGFSKISKS